MPNGHDYTKEYGPHEYPAAPDHTSDCKFGCGCWAGPARSGGPLGLDPFGECPGNPKDGRKLGVNTDYEIVVTRRIRVLESRAYNAEQEVERLKYIKNTPKANLVDRVKKLESQIRILKEFTELVNKNLPRD